MFGFFSKEKSVGLLERRAKILSAFEEARESLHNLQMDLADEAMEKRDQIVCLEAEVGVLDTEILSCGKIHKKLTELLS